MLRRERISEQLKQKRLETSKPKGRPFKYPENKLKKEEMIRQLNELILSWNTLTYRNNTDLVYKEYMKSIHDYDMMMNFHIF